MIPVAPVASARSRVVRNADGSGKAAGSVLFWFRARKGTGQGHYPKQVGSLLLHFRTFGCGLVEHLDCLGRFYAVGNAEWLSTPGEQRSHLQPVYHAHKICRAGGLSFAPADARTIAAKLLNGQRLARCRAHSTAKERDREQ